MRDLKGKFTKGHCPHPNWIKKWVKPRVEKICSICGKRYEVSVTSKQKTCSKKCSNVLVGRAHLGRGKGVCENHGYIRSTRKGPKKYLHRVVMEEYLGRKLLKTEQVHHINGDKKDNRIENLEVMTAREHQKLHKNKKQKIDIKCNSCGIVFKGFETTHRTRYCNKKCYKKYIRLNNKKYE